MSEFNCPEPGCGFHIGIAGDLVTDEDFEAQDYYDQEIEVHQQMHAGAKATDKQDAYWVKVAPDTAAWLDHHGLMLESQDKSGQALPNPLHVEGRNISEVVGSPLAARYKEREFGSVPIELAVVPGLSAAEFSQKSSIGRRVRVVSAGLDRGVSRDVEGDYRAQGFSDRERDRAVRFFIEPFFDAFREGEGQSGPRVECVVAVDGDVHLEISLSVGGAPGGAGVGTSESTERGNKSLGHVEEKPSAVAAAEGDEIKTNR